MKTSQSFIRSVRGSAAPKIIVAALVIAAAAAGAWWYLKQRDVIAPIAAPIAAGTEVPGTEAAAPAVSPAVEELTIDQLYREARKAMSEQRMVTPAGNNALEFYLAILAKEPTNSGAMEALRELFPFASGTAEQEINQGNVPEATRIIDSLAKADPSNYTLTILRSKLEAKKKQLEQQEALATAAAATPVPVPAPAATPPAETVAAGPGTDAPKEAPPTAAAPPPTPVAVAPPPVAAPQGETRDVVVVAPVAPTYPGQAARNRQEGWVEVEFTVTAEGNVEGAKVTASEPPRVFDKAAISSIEKTKFNARLENGVAVASTVRRRIEFNLGR